MGKTYKDRRKVLNKDFDFVSKSKKKDKLKIKNSSKNFKFMDNLRFNGVDYRDCSRS